MNLRVITFNLRCCNDPGGNSIKERAPRLKRILKRENADIIGFQEVRSEWLCLIRRSYGFKYCVYNVKRSSADGESTPVLYKRSKFKLIKRGVFWLSPTPDTASGGFDDYGKFRICTYVILKSKATGERFLFMNTHLGFGDEAQAKSVALITEKSVELGSLPTVITGDFNFTPSSQAYAQMLKSFSDANAQTANDFSPTYHGYGKGNPSHIDYCFINGGFAAQSCKLLTSEHGAFVSDHHGILCELDTNA